ncbi:MAG: heterodisulfide reductase subunit [Desulfonauticus sp.]|jgi:heterodisulfide reductase subunit B|nr:heterodisulfide reductase subunit [Desulfonauticus sp.]
MEKVGLFLGCNIPFRAPDIEKAFRSILPEFGIEPVDLEGASCCPAWGTAPSFDLDTWLSLSGRNISLAEEKGVDITTGCNSCFGVLSEAKHMIEHKPGKFDVVNEKLKLIGREYKGTSKIYHIMHLLYAIIGPEKIKEKIKYNFEGIKVAVQQGCHSIWPSDVYEVKEENPFFPIHLKTIVEATGAEAPHYSRIEDCCGMGAMSSSDREKSLQTFKRKISSIKEEIDPDVVVTGCSSCYLQFDGSQKVLKERGDIDFEIPVFHVTQFLAIALGFDPKLVAGICQVSRDEIVKEMQSEKRLVK